MPKSRWNIRDAIKVFFAYIILMFIGMPVLVQFIRIIFGRNILNIIDNTSVILFLSFFINVLVCTYVFYIVKVVHRQSIAALGLSTINLPSNIKWGIKQYLFTLPFIIIAGIIVNLISSYFDITPEMQDVVQWVLEEKSFFILASLLFFGVILAPVMEEILFRGFLLPALKNTFGSRYAIVISAFLFAGIHMDMFAILQIFILGLLLGYVYEKTQTLAAPIIIHVLHNSLTLMFLLYFKFFLKGKVPLF
ncbi:MAG: CPBP family intramembrane metalloprotease [wastewater metagenome]|nr:CPBP family intramembrane metalloprotease [Candidatus Loosdrechtia aerotolerans]